MHVMRHTLTTWLWCDPVVLAAVALGCGAPDHAVANALNERAGDERHAGQPDGAAEAQRSTPQTVLERPGSPPANPTIDPRLAPVVEWMRSRAVSLEHPTRIASALANARVVGLGEATHGQHESFEAKRALTMELVRAHGFRVVAYEASAARARACDAYVQGASDDATAALQGLGMLVWRVEENAALLDDLRAWNRAVSPSDRVRIVGVDVQDPAAAAERLAELVRGRSIELADRALSIAPGIDAAVQRLWSGDIAEYERLSQLAQSVLDDVEAQRETFGASADEAALRARELRLAIGMYHSQGGRDRALAEMLVAQLRDGERAVWWAHDAHVACGALRYLGVDELAAGGHLRRALGDAYVSVGFAYGEGEFAALEQDPAGAWRFATYRTAPPPPGSLEEVLQLALGGSGFVDLRGAPNDGVVGAWLDAGHGQRWYGGYRIPADAYEQSGDAERLMPTFPRSDFDAFVFLERTSASRPTKP